MLNDASQRHKKYLDGIFEFNGRVRMHARTANYKKLTTYV